MMASQMGRNMLCIYIYINIYNLLHSYQLCLSEHKKNKSGYIQQWGDGKGKGKFTVHSVKGHEGPELE
jgi:hypothetical protein